MNQPVPALRLLRPLRVDIEALEDVFEGHADAMSCLDLETGAVVRVNLDDELRARRVLGNRRRYAPIPQDDPSDAWRDMVDYTDEVEDPALRRRLRDALKGKAATRRFREILWDTKGFDEWAMFARQRARSRIVEWLAGLGIGGFYDE